MSDGFGYSKSVLVFGTEVDHADAVTPVVLLLCSELTDSSSLCSTFSASNRNANAPEGSSAVIHGLPKITPWEFFIGFNDRKLKKVTTVNGDVCNTDFNLFLILLVPSERVP
ncbi:hypothetical protein PsorP6_002326 [Peronosclerospora sorghi]|uniref:Uncharacterized protein n=1 Tax=Peronosclerospora sorghi TaxID=230839 RepID=A0ACC0WUG3_9STRA|nr:hypothetical protein PsorP6_002326 [Peronosclerospora sorghi]